MPVQVIAAQALNQTVDFDIGDDNLEAIDSVTRMLLAGIPNAELREPPAKRTAEAE
jgi:hypothetical protein